MTSAIPLPPSKRRSALLAIPAAIGLEILCILFDVGGLVTILLAFVVCFAVVHLVRVRRARG